MFFKNQFIAGWCKSSTPRSFNKSALLREIFIVNGVKVGESPSGQRRAKP
jgi:hypothetical protein